MSRKTFVIDTNVLLHDPDAISKFKGGNVVIPLGVLEELDGMKISFTELVAVTKVIPVYCGIVQESSPNVEPVQAPAVDQIFIPEVSQPIVGTDSTSTSALVFPDGILSTSTTT